MKLTKVKDKIHYSVGDSIYHKCFYKINDLTSFRVKWKIRNEIYTPNIESIEDMQKRTLNNLQNEIN